MLLKSFVDIHCHALFGVDDGAADAETMCKMLQMAYLDGTRTLCMTPHCGDERSLSKDATAAFSQAEAYCREHCPDMTLYMGNELTYQFGCVELLAQKKCRTIAETRYVLVDFFMVPDVGSVFRGVDALLNAGYLPIVAHVERYECFSGKIKEVARLSETGAFIQINAPSLLMGPFSAIGRTAKKILAEGLADLVASDGHDAVSRTPTLSSAYRVVQDKHGDVYADYLFSQTPARILAGERIYKNR